MQYFDLPIAARPRTTNLIRAVERASAIRSDFLDADELCLVKNTKPMGRGDMFLRIGSSNMTDDRLTELKELIK